MQKRSICLFAVSVISMACFTSSFAAKPIALDSQKSTLLQQITTKEIKRNIDFNHTTHVRFQQMFNGLRVWGADGVMHIPNGALAADATMNGTVYQDLDKDLGPMPANLAGNEQQALTEAIKQTKDLNGFKVSDSKVEPIIFVDGANKAHYAYLVSFLAKGEKGMPKKPTYLMDAKTFKVYQAWDNIQTLDDIKGGGFGGNKKTGKFSYDGIKDDLPQLNMERDDGTKVCYLENTVVKVKDRRKGDAIATFPCTASDTNHNEYWDADFDAVNGGFSPSNDALYAGEVVQDMYQKWYKVPALVDSNGKPMILGMRVHEDMDNAYWDGSQMTFGDGISIFYPLVSLGVSGHEVSHGFTEQHSGLSYYGQSGGLNESFSDMAAQAAEYYSVGKNSWQIGPEIFKQDGEALRYMDKPSKDCPPGSNPGNWCSIDNMSQYHDGIDVHFSSGIFNRVFYLIGTAQNWDTKKAFDVMVQANMNYWTSNVKFKDAACGVIKATNDYKYDLDAVKKAFDVVGVNISKC